MSNSEETRFTLRIDNKVLAKVKDSAIQNKRSTAKEIEYILEKYFQEVKSNESKSDDPTRH